MLVLSAMLLVAAAIEFLPSKYDGMPRCEEIKAVAPSLRAGALNALRRRIGLVVADRDEILLRFRDASADPDGAEGKPMALRRTETVEGRECVTITLFWEYLVTGQADAQEETTHEYVHAVHRLNLGRERYVKVPRWVREGLALHVADQGPARVRWILQDRIQAVPEALADGLEGDAHDLNDYAEDYLAFQYLEDEYGAARLAAVARDILTGARAWDDAILAHTGESRSVFLDQAGRYSRSALRLVDDGLRDRLLPLLASQAEGRPAEAAAGLREFLVRHPRAYCSPLARLALARCDLALRRIPEARIGFAAILSTHAADLGQVDEAKYGLGLCALAEGDRERAEREFGELERDFPWSTDRIAEAKRARERDGR